jgi:hypothetical protein
MPKGFEWVVMDVNDPVQLQEIYTLLTENYVEDDDNMFRSGLSLSLSGLSDSLPLSLPRLSDLST